MFFQTLYGCCGACHFPNFTNSIRECSSTSKKLLLGREDAADGGQGGASEKNQEQSQWKDKYEKVRAEVKELSVSQSITFPYR